jgi:hypothetical protein
MNRYRVELRATPDTPIEEEFARRSGKVLGAQCVIYHICADTHTRACERAFELERCQIHRKDIWVFSTRETGKDLSGCVLIEENINEV